VKFTYVESFHLVSLLKPFVRTVGALQDPSLSKLLPVFWTSDQTKVPVRAPLEVAVVLWCRPKTHTDSSSSPSATAVCTQFSDRWEIVDRLSVSIAR
jgi:hypothetical protein